MVKKTLISSLILALVFMAVMAAPATPAKAAAAVVAVDQALSGAVVNVPEVTADAPGWMVIHATSEGFPVIGKTYVPAGTTSNVMVIIDVNAATAENLAMLHIDAGEAGVYEFPGPDVPVKDSYDKVIAPPFKILGAWAADQFVSAENTVTVNTVIAQNDGWIVIHASSDGFPVAGQAAIKAGVNKDVVVTVDPAIMTERVTAMIHDDLGVVGTYEFPGADGPSRFAAGGAIVNEPFWTTEHVRTMGQLAGSDSKLWVASALIKEDGWMAIHATSEGFPVIGIAPLKAGLNRNVEVTVETAGLTPTVLAMLHTDAGEKGKYEFPGPDVPVNGADGNPIAPPMLVGAGVVVEDAPADRVTASGMVEVRGVVAAQNGFMVIHATSEGFPAIGAQFVQKGYNPRVWVKVDPARITPEMLAMLHIDVGTAGVYEFPGADVPVLGADGKPIAPPFKLIGN
ncbi:MAG TPA: hypothetical protein PLD47_18385 [Aggregatilineales bacterium]|nr:hypothetical protein [Anaerolineales bacterium]HRE49697.1 hypothetical protein [Aggregatilineales bacterium]